MTAYSSDRCVSAAAAGEDWRDAARQVLAALDRHLTGDPGFNLGFVYITDRLVPEAQNILSLLRSVTHVENWVGTVGIGICGTGADYVDEPAIAVMMGRFGDGDFLVFSGIGHGTGGGKAALEAWLEENEAMLGVVHGRPVAGIDPALAEFYRMTGGFLTGGLGSSRADFVKFAGGIAEGNLSGVLFTQDVQAATALTQGCAPLGPVHTVTRCEDHVVMELDGQRAYDVFAADIYRKAGLEDGEISSGGDPRTLLSGSVHVAIPVSGSDQRDYLVRNIVGLDPERGWVAVGHDTDNGDRIMFVHRDDQTVRADLSRMLIEIRERVTRDKGGFSPSGALYISCVARIMSDFGGGPGSEMALVQEVLGDIPLAGFYANGEISNGRLYGYTGVLILFL